jgi:hypothetical protein
MLAKSSNAVIESFAYSIDSACRLSLDKAMAQLSYVFAASIGAGLT